MISESDLDLIRRLGDSIRAHKPCKGYGYVLVKGVSEMCECRKEALYQFRLVRSGIPVKFRSMGFGDYAYKAADAYKHVQDYLDKAADNRESNMGLFLEGPHYTGKSLFLCSILMALIHKGYDCRYIECGSLMKLSDEAKAAVERCDFLGIDGLGDLLNKLTNFKQSTLTDERVHGAADFIAGLLSGRINNGLPVLVTSSVSLSSINEHFPVVSNALLGQCRIIKLEDKGFRQKKIEQMMGGDA